MKATNLIFHVTKISHLASLGAPREKTDSYVLPLNKISISPETGPLRIIHWCVGTALPVNQGLRRYPGALRSVPATDNA